MAQFKKSKFVDLVSKLSEMSINEEYQYFSYKHFFVIFCKFYDLEATKYLKINLESFSSYDTHAINPILCPRILKGYGYPPDWRATKNGEYCVRNYYYYYYDTSNTDSAVDLIDISKLIERDVNSLSYFDFICNDNMF